MTEQAEQAYVEQDTWHESPDDRQVEDALEVLYPDEAEPAAEDAEPAEPAQPDATADAEPEPQQAAETDDDEDSDPYEQAYRESAEDTQLAQLAQAETQQFYRDTLQAAHALNIDPKRAAQAIQAGKVNDVLQAIEAAANSKAEEIAKEDKNKGAAARTQAGQVVQALKQSAEVLGQVGQHFQTKQQAREEQKLQRKIDREKKKLPADFDREANKRYMKAKGYTDEQIRGVTTARDALIIDAARRQEEAESSKPSKPNKPIRLPRKARKAKDKEPEQELSRIDQKNADIRDMYRPKPKQQQRKTSDDDVLSILYGS